MQSKGLRPDVYTYNGLLDICVRDHGLKGKRLSAGRAVVGRMDLDGVGRDAATANLLMQCARADGNSAEAMSLFEAMGRRGRDRRSYTIAVSMSESVSQALSLIDRAKSEGVGANTHMYNAALDVGLSHGVGSYQKVRDKMRADRVWSNAQTTRLDLRAERRKRGGGGGRGGRADGVIEGEEGARRASSK
jgi:hypothetical protein